MALKPLIGTIRAWPRKTGCSASVPRQMDNKKPQPYGLGFGVKTLAMTYSCMYAHTTIGAVAFHFRVRDGIGWFHNAMVTRERVEGRFGSVDPERRALVG